MVNVYEQIARNKFKSTLIISLFVGFILAAAYFIAYAFNLDNTFLIGAFVFSLFISGISYFFGDQIVLSLNGAKPALREDYFDFYTVTENLSQADQLPMPKNLCHRFSSYECFFHRP